ncbi:MBL fold metallo-hydrolase [Paenibacillus sambharensis]|uniref:MBL fold metallo-hydrolase n=1 Tax=Paenibacillus sambharensis TaxID=1803190 RepID=A0A2W1LF28_9BACL|nr:MBL fold metallo-hydrolase [Paenibacillus sambharensis]PZD93672.1 MBL fold metallo-hydrolase [Paenibacillus sambharensis]
MTAITFMGTGDTMGVPRVYCDCAVCEEARTSGVNRRLRSLLHIEDKGSGHTLIDCGPDWGKQMEAANLKDVDRVLVTHAHFDHIGGLVEWADACRWLNKRGQMFAPAEVIADIDARFPWIKNHIDRHEADQGVKFGDWLAMPWRVNHGKNGYAYAYRFDNRVSAYSWVYCSDSIGLSASELKPMEGLDLLVLGTSFYQEPYPYPTRSVYDIVEALQLIDQLKPAMTVFTHMSHDIDLNADYSLPAHVRLSHTGMTLPVG